ncbi:CTP synthase [Buttiauxella sp. WJP83]|uniref:CTP synthase C-terminal region-related (seleno)protein n=1 Tax=Buttiauxella sp. WJP83 TaxID=2986951 RepID=UPI0022DDA9FF|nr:CTP synthase [Buttiauxella sp. WJP83]WBM69102.1 CTP synthase [Buttiauxella sp. WJP83]
MSPLPLKETLRVALVGDYNSTVIAHQAIPLALDNAAEYVDVTVDYDWLPTPEVTSPEDLVGYDAIWCVPASPYQNEDGALLAIRYARENQIPFLGTCGGFQHAIIEYARNVLDWHDAGHAETSRDGRLVIGPLSCSLVEKSDAIELKAGSLIAEAYGRSQIEEGYHCNYGIADFFTAHLASSQLQPTGWDNHGEIRVVELRGHPFFVGTLFQHERNALKDKPAPLVEAFLKAALL